MTREWADSRNASLAFGAHLLSSNSIPSPSKDHTHPTFFSSGPQAQAFHNPNNFPRFSPPPKKTCAQHSSKKINQDNHNNNHNHHNNNNNNNHNNNSSSSNKMPSNNNNNNNNTDAANQSGGGGRGGLGWTREGAGRGAIRGEIQGHGARTRVS